MNVAEVLETNTKLELSKSFHKWHPLDVSYGPTKLWRGEGGGGEGGGREGER